MDYKTKYLKYKIKYENLINQSGGNPVITVPLVDLIKDQFYTIHLTDDDKKDKDAETGRSYFLKNYGTKISIESQGRIYCCKFIEQNQNQYIFIKNGIEFKLFNKHIQSVHLNNFDSLRNKC